MISSGTIRHGVERTLQPGDWDLKDQTYWDDYGKKLDDVLMSMGWYLGICTEGTFPSRSCSN